MLKKLPRRFRKRERGASAVELALVLPILLALVMGIIEFGWIFNGYIIINGAAREGARLAARGELESVIETRVKNHAEFILNADGTIDKIEIPADRDSIAPGGEITVMLEGKIPLLLFGNQNFQLIRFPFLPDPYPLWAKAKMRKEY
jgi:Flp pilus assembly pilin Flp